ncbi:hypothetical protein ATN89_17055 [Comamonas thiooxydans]|uniref:hypothetical protein n=1 Tax=Comamonas thiooxydans TaxID=363952 RepID=UPI0007C541E6|nr:hypothetical protein [Comamonas thiooxydans]OAD82927.1 hypothetical protein ATN89_17055 [Comamonas thiooxydans]
MTEDTKLPSLWQKGCDDARTGREPHPNAIAQAVAEEHGIKDGWKITCMRRGYTNGYLYGGTLPKYEFEPCGGCGEEHPDKVCIGCAHPFKRVA